MIGNDIIDLDFVQERKSLNNRFLNKVFNKAEQRLIHHASSPEKTLWLLWAMKESSYKLYVQKGGELGFMPLHFKAKLVRYDHGYVQYDGEIYYTRSKINKDHILAEASLKKNNQVKRLLCHFDKTDYQTQYAGLRVSLKRVLSAQFGIASKNIALKKSSSGVPQLYFYGKLQRISLSLSHHGKYGLISYQDLNFNKG